MASTKWSSCSRDCHSDPYQGTLKGTKPLRVVIGHQAPDSSVEECTKRSSGRMKSKAINEFETSKEKTSLINVCVTSHFVTSAKHMFSIYHWLAMSTTPHCS